MDDYDKISQVISYLLEHARQQPSLTLLAEKAGLSPSHLQRKFTAWTGISPKSFLQHLTQQQARAMLNHGKPLEQVAWDTGLSGPGRLHDLCIKIEAATPGEIRRGGEGLDISFGFGPTPFGDCLLADTPRGICYIAFVGPQSGLDELYKLWPRATYTPAPNRTQGLIRQVFNLQTLPVQTPLRAYVKGTQFQLQIWRALLNIPEGRLVSYSDIATAIRRPDAARAAGSAIGANQLAYLIPCHRVIRNTGIVGDYRWGSNRKKMILACEYARHQASPGAD